MGSACPEHLGHPNGTKASRASSAFLLGHSFALEQTGEANLYWAVLGGTYMLCVVTML